MKSRKFWIKFGIGFSIFAILAGVFLIWPIYQLTKSVGITKSDVGVLQKQISALDVIAADKQIDLVRKDLVLDKSNLGGLAWVGFAPFFNLYYMDVNHMLNAADEGLQGGKIITTSLVPFADVLGLKASSGGTADEKLQKAVEVMPKIAPQTDAVAVKMKMANDELSHINPNRYPGKIGSLDIKDNLKSAKDLASLINDFMPQAKDVLTYAPIGLGAPIPKTYMVIFQNDKELRPTGGFLTAYTFANFDKGKVTTSKTDDIYNLDVSVSSKPRAPSPILKYLPLVSQWNLRDSNLSPDFQDSMATFEQMYRKSPKYASNDGYIGVDTYFLQSLLRLTGPVKTASTGDTFTADNVVEKMETYAEKVFTNSSNRKGFLGELMKGVMDKLKNAKSDQWPSIINSVLTSANEKHFLLYAKDSPVQSLIEHYDWGGRVKNYEGDYLHVNDTNFAGAKANLYVKERIIQDINISSDGSITKKTTVEVTNPEKSDGWLNGPYRDWVRMYVPEGSEISSSSGGEVKTSSTASELGKTMFESFFIARPLGYSSSNKATWSVTYTLPFKASAHNYKLLIQKQPGVDGPQVVININGKKMVDEQLRFDKEYSLSY